ncbi:hypothetical protein FNF27_01408 [Cafeteria roenbergensis]|uniref:C2 domain-containing protein n=2 Tax=Cafeteria roenbergensis TaxID=33653 RepID=A0A5A8EIP4_CAFRO|nr:hypothetical protein FNF27_01408 [Cafeteria roenbergensis]
MAEAERAPDRLASGLTTWQERADPTVAGRGGAGSGQWIGEWEDESDGDGGEEWNADFGTGHAASRGAAGRGGYADEDASEGQPDSDGDEGDEDDEDDWLSAYFAHLVRAAAADWLPLGEAASFLHRGALRAVDVIYASVGPVGPPATPASGSMFIVDERRLPAWRGDGYPHGGAGGTAQFDVRAARAARLRGLPAGTPSLPEAMGANGARPGTAEATVVVEWSDVNGEGLQRRAMRLPRPSGGRGSRVAEEDDASGAGWVWLIQYLHCGVRAAATDPSYDRDGVPLDEFDDEIDDEGDDGEGQPEDGEEWGEDEEGFESGEGPRGRTAPGDEEGDGRAPASRGAAGGRHGGAASGTADADDFDASDFSSGPSSRREQRPRDVGSTDGSDSDGESDYGPEYGVSGRHGRRGQPGSTRSRASDVTDPYAEPYADPYADPYGPAPERAPSSAVGSRDVDTEAYMAKIQKLKQQRAAAATASAAGAEPSEHGGEAPGSGTGAGASPAHGVPASARPPPAGGATGVSPSAAAATARSPQQAARRPASGGAKAPGDDAAWAKEAAVPGRRRLQGAELSAATEAWSRVGRESADRLLALVRGWQTRWLLASGRLQALATQIRDSQALIAEAAGDGGGGSRADDSALIKGVRAQVRTDSSELAAVTAPETLGEEWAKARRVSRQAKAAKAQAEAAAAAGASGKAAAKARKGKSAAQEQAAERRKAAKAYGAAKRKEHQAKLEAAQKAEEQRQAGGSGAAGAGEGAGAKRRSGLPSLAERRRAAARAKRPAAAIKGMGSELDPSPRWRVVLQVLAARGLPQRTLMAGVRGSGPGMVGDAAKRLDPDSAGNTDGSQRELYAESFLYLTAPLPKAEVTLDGDEDGDALWRLEEAGSAKGKVMGSRKSTDTVGGSLEPKWEPTTFSFVVAPKLAMLAARAGRAAAGLEDQSPTAGADAKLAAEAAAAGGSSSEAASGAAGAAAASSAGADAADGSAAPAAAPAAAAPSDTGAPSGDGASPAPAPGAGGGGGAEAAPAADPAAERKKRARAEAAAAKEWLQATVPRWGAIPASVSRVTRLLPAAEDAAAEEDASPGPRRVLTAVPKGSRSALQVRVDVRDADRFAKDTHLGCVRLPLSAIGNDEEPEAVWVRLRPAEEGFEDRARWEDGLRGARPGRGADDEPGSPEVDAAGAVEYDPNRRGDDRHWISAVMQAEEDEAAAAAAAARGGRGSRRGGGRQVPPGYADGGGFDDAFADGLGDFDDGVDAFEAGGYAAVSGRGRAGAGAAADWRDPGEGLLADGAPRGYAAPALRYDPSDDGDEGAGGGGGGGDGSGYARRRRGDRWPRASEAAGSETGSGRPARARPPRALDGGVLAADGVPIMRRESSSGFPISRAEIEALATGSRRAPSSAGSADRGSYVPDSEVGSRVPPPAAWQAELEAFEADLHRRMRSGRSLAGQGAAESGARDPEPAFGGSLDEADDFFDTDPRAAEAWAARDEAEAERLARDHVRGSSAGAPAEAPRHGGGVVGALSRLEQLEADFNQMVSPAPRPRRR